MVFDVLEKLDFKPLDFQSGGSEFWGVITYHYILLRGFAFRKPAKGTQIFVRVEV